ERAGRRSRQPAAIGTGTMTSRIEHSVAVQEQHRGEPETQPREARGSFRGEGVTTTRSQQSLLHDAAEELTFTQSERLEQEEIIHRKVEGRVPALPAPGDIDALFDKLPESGGKEKLREAVKKILEQGAQTPEQLLQLTQQAFDDVSLQFLL